MSENTTSKVSDLPEMIYGIKVPYISNGLKRTYNKQLEVCVFKLVENEGIVKYYQTGTTKFNSLNKFKETNSGNVTINIRNNLRIHDSVSTETYMYSRDNMMLYTDINSAYISKLLLVRAMKQRYENELENLRNTMAKNIPDLDAHLAEATDAYPELFV